MKVVFLFAKGWTSTKSGVLSGVPLVGARDGGGQSQLSKSMANPRNKVVLSIRLSN